MSAFRSSAGATLGTTPPIKLPKGARAGAIKPGEGYFRVRIHGAQAVIHAPFWQKVKQVAVTSEVKLYYPPFGGEPIQSSQRIRSLRRGAAEQLGLATNLVDLTPAGMDRVTIAIEYLLDAQNRLAMLAKLVNDDAFLSVISLAPGAAAVAKSVATLSKKMIDTFMDRVKREPILRFVGDFSLLSGDFSDAYYVILGSRYDHSPLPRPLPDSTVLEVRGHELFYNRAPVTRWSYVVLDVDTVEARTKALGRGEPWYEKLDEADVKADVIQNNPLAKEKDRRETWDSCQELLKEADTLLRRAPLYLASEAEAIIQEAYHSISRKIFSRISGSLAAPPGLSAGMPSFLRVAGEQDLQAKVKQYAAIRSRSQEKLIELGLLQT